MKTEDCLEVQLPAFLPMTWDGGEWVASYKAAILPWTGREGTRGRLLWRTENLINRPQESIHESSIIQHIAQTLDWLSYHESIQEGDYHILHTIKFILQRFLIMIRFTNIMFGMAYCLTFPWFSSVTPENGGIVFEIRLRPLFQNFLPIFIRIVFSVRPSWLCGLRNMSAAARDLELWVRILLRKWIFVCYVCCVLCK
jgi:hypothetical protein